MRDGFAIVVGAYDAVGVPADVRARAHNHPGPSRAKGHEGKIKDLPANAAGMSFADIIADPQVAREAGIVPSVNDIHGISDGTDHTIYTRYVHVGDGKIANPKDGANGARVSIHLSDTRVALQRPESKHFYYETQMQVKDAAGNVLWSGTIYTEWFALAPGGTVRFKRPPVLDRPEQAGWQRVK